MGELVKAVSDWRLLTAALIVFGVAPGLALRAIVLMYPRHSPRRQELVAELYAVPRWERPFWVAEKIEVALFEGLLLRVRESSLSVVFVNAATWLALRMAAVAALTALIVLAGSLVGTLTWIGMESVAVFWAKSMRARGIEFSSTVSPRTWRDGIFWILCLISTSLTFAGSFIAAPQDSWGAAAMLAGAILFQLLMWGGTVPAGSNRDQLVC